MSDVLANHIFIALMSLSLSSLLICSENNRFSRRTLQIFLQNDFEKSKALSWLLRYPA